MIHSFPPVAEQDAKILILGSIPGIKSLETQQYYAHPMNQFWRILFDLFHQEQASEYDNKILFLKHHHIALWDVIQQCERKGSLDSGILTIVPNEFAPFFQHHPQIRALFFNGIKAKETYSKYYKNLSFPAAEFFCLPSTSPANVMPYTDKLLRWKTILDWL